MTRVEPLPREQLAEFETFFQLAEGAMGFVPNSLLTLGRSPALLQAFSALTGAVLAGTSIDPHLRTMISMVVSNAAGCRYCQAHTTHTGDHQGLPQEKLDAVYAFDDSPLFSDAEKAALTVARAAGFVPNETTDAMFEELHRHFSELEIVEIVAVISLFGWLNRWNDTMATQLEAQPLDFAKDRLTSHGWSPGKHEAG
jgi:uncharacterized peroxidase-related enzyme